MAKLTNVRERVHQPFRDSLIRTGGYSAGNLQDRTKLFTASGKNEGETNMPNGSTLPSDQSMVVLALRVFVWFKAPIARGASATASDGAAVYPDSNGDFAFSPNAAGNSTTTTWNQVQATLTAGNGVGSTADVLRLYHQAEDQLLWSFGAGDKYSMTSMPSAYFPYGGGLHGDLGGATNLIFLNNGMPDHTGILRLARAILLPPRQAIKCEAQIVAYPDGGNATTFASTQGVRNMLSLTSNLNVIDLINKVITFTFDGLFSRDVQ